MAPLDAPVLQAALGELGLPGCGSWCGNGAASAVGLVSLRRWPRPCSRCPTLRRFYLCPAAPNCCAAQSRHTATFR